MNWYRNHLVLILTAVPAFACHPGEVVPPPPPPPPPAQVDELVHRSPCDVLSETRPVIGNLGGPHGYPRWNGNAIEPDPSGVRQSPDVNVIHNLTGGLTFENEVHDCQRLVLVVGNALEFGPLVGLLPLDDAMELKDDEFDPGIVAATVYNWGDFHGAPQEYDPLDIGRRRNCLWIWDDPQTAWRAALVHHPAGTCSTQSPPDTSAYTLDVQRALHAGPMPKTARWEWDARRSINIMGLKCGSAWCRVGPTAFWPAETVQLTGIDPQSTIPGYFDEQHLAVPGGSGIVPGPIGVVTPTDTFFTLVQAQGGSPTDPDVLGAAFATGLDVATVTLRDPTAPTPPTYRAKWGGFAQRPVTLHLQVQGGTGPSVATFMSPTGGKSPPVTPRRLLNTLHAAVGTVRWRWHDTATTASIWSGCGVRGMDCCDTQ